MGLTTDTANR